MNKKEYNQKYNKLNDNMFLNAHNKTTENTI